MLLIVEFRSVHSLCKQIMLIASKGRMKLVVEIDEEIRVKPIQFNTELYTTAFAIAGSIRVLLRHETRYNKKPNKEEVVTSYMKRLGWIVDHVLVNPIS